jgi:ubiquinone/menaquinone biosynthesis C-methylase UbiE
VGSSFEAAGLLEYHLLLSEGLQPDHYVIDVGCGSGRLAVQLASHSRLRYTGIDIVPALLEYANSQCSRPDWRFVQSEQNKIPEKNNAGDFVCFFSVFTHLKHEDSYGYLEEAFRTLKPGGKVVFSFLEFRIYNHWAVFDSSLKNRNGVLNQFMDRDAINVWAREIGFRVDSIHDGDKPHIPIPDKVTWEHGLSHSGSGHLGQSVAILSKPD